jgi:tetratricopeptide (TPR) repeat protein
MLQNRLTTLSLVAVLALLVFIVDGCATRLSSFTKRTDSSADEGKDAKTLSAEAYALMQQNNLPAAIEKARHAVQRDPTFAEAQKNLALAYCDSGHVDEALGPGQKAVALAPEFDKAHFVLGKILFGLGHFEDSIKELREATRINPSYDKAYFKLGLVFDRMGDLKEAEAAFDQAVSIKPDDLTYQGVRDKLRGYVRVQSGRDRAALIVPRGRTREYATAVYSGIFYECLIHQNYDLIEKSAEEVRISKEKLPGAAWKLQKIYAGLKEPWEAESASDYEWNDYLRLLQQWADQKPESVTAKVAIANTYVAYAWHARGTGFANTVSEENGRLFLQRLAAAKRVLTLVPEPDRLCPKWYSVMLRIALGEGWKVAAYDELFGQAVSFEPTWYEYYEEKATFLLPRWHGKPGDLQQYLSSLQQRPGGRDGAIIYFLINQFAVNYDPQVDATISFSRIKQGFSELQNAYGASADQLNWACLMAMRFNDRPFAKKLFSQISDDWYESVWGSKDSFDAAKSLAMAE